MQLAKHYTVLVYPFRHVLPESEGNRQARLERLAGAWRPWWGRLDSYHLPRALEDTNFFRPHLRRLLFPETDRLPVDGPKMLAEAERLRKLPPHLLDRELSPGAVLRLTFDLARLGPPGSWKLVQPREEKGKIVGETFSALCRLAWIDVALFPQNVALLLLKVELEGEATVTVLRDFLTYLNPILARGWNPARWQRGGDRPGPEFQNRDLIDFVLQGLTDKPDPKAGSLDDFLGLSLSHDDRYTMSPFGHSYGQKFHLFNFACLAGEKPEEPPEEEEGGKKGKKLFASPVEQALYELVTCTDPTRPDWVPHRSMWTDMRKRGLIRLWESWQGLALVDHVVFLGNWESRINMKTLASNVEGQYLNLYLLSLFQKTRLSIMFGETVRRESNLHRNRKEAQRLWRDFLMFQNRYWFSEVTPRPQGAIIYQRFQRGLGILPLHEEMSQEVNQLQEYYEGHYDRGIGAFLFILTFVGVPIGLLAQLFGPKLVEGMEWAEIGWITLGIVASSILALLVWWWYMRKE